MADRDDLSLFQAYGIELEYMIVDAESLDVRPLAEQLLSRNGAAAEQSFEDGDITWSNELATHVIELKTSGPVTDIRKQSEGFNHSLTRINAELADMQACLLPTAMHPWMDPYREFKRWPHGDREIYATLDQIFDCRGHGWANLQSMHINLPFQGDDEFSRLHSAIRLVLPILPGLAASSPLMDSRQNGWLDNRMRVYKDNCRRIPSITGKVIPEIVSSYQEYQDKILQPMYDDIADQDPDGILAYEWLNARGAIARFDRNAIEIRVMDTQEAVTADLAFAELAVATVQGLVEEQWSTQAQQKLWSVGSLATLLEQSMRQGDQAEIHEGVYLKLFGFTRQSHTRVLRLWEQLANAATAQGRLSDDAGRVIEHYLRHGCLARRITRALHADSRHSGQVAVYRQLSECLKENRLFSMDIL